MFATERCKHKAKWYTGLINYVIHKYVKPGKKIRYQYVIL